MSLRRAQRQLQRQNQQQIEVREYAGFPPPVIVRAPGLDKQGAFWGGKVDTCKSILVPGQDEYDGRGMAKQLRRHGFLDTTEYPTVKDF